ncbi:unnamed protein product [Sphagnum troendelagicum]|uniref:HMG box domain-containing protein n=1 Tax=Sphagnum troendelagicum TaxID=128251 RepID=A0ABP0USW9_9BRYO
MATKRGKRAAKNVDPEKENATDGAGIIPMPLKKAAVKPKALTVNNMSLEEELETMTKTLKQMSIEKEESEARLKLKEDELQAKAAEAERINEQLKLSDEGKKKLEEKLRKLQKLKEFQPTLSLGVPLPSDDMAKKKKKNSNRLKKPKSAFLLWSKEQRQAVSEEHPNASFAEMSAIMGEKWKSVSEEERKPYLERYQIEKDIYLKLVGQEKREAEALKLLHEEQSKKQGQELLEQYLAYKKQGQPWLCRKEKDPLKPKHPTTAFFAFCNSRRPALLEAKTRIPEIGKILGEEWKALSDAKRVPFEKIAATEKTRYAAELEAYKVSKAEESTAAEKEMEEKVKLEKVHALQLFKQKEKTDQAKKLMKDLTKEKKKAKEQAKDPNRPKKPLSSYLIFSMEMRKILDEEKPGMTFAEMNALIALKWKETSDKQIWNDKAAAAKERYTAEMDEYNKDAVMT